VSRAASHLRRRMLVRWLLAPTATALWPLTPLSKPKFKLIVTLAPWKKGHRDRETNSMTLRDTQAQRRAAPVAWLVLRPALLCASAEPRSNAADPSSRIEGSNVLSYIRIAGSECHLHCISTLLQQGAEFGCSNRQCNRHDGLVVGHIGGEISGDCVLIPAGSGWARHIDGECLNGILEGGESERSRSSVLRQRVSRGRGNVHRERSM
jgi:hypothetical protein